MITVNVCNLSKNFGTHTVLHAISMEFHAGQIYGLVGRNGSGKSVFLKCIAGLFCPSAGYAEVLGKRIGQDVDFAPDTGISIEQPGLLLQKSAYENLRILSSLTQKSSPDEIKRLLQLVGLQEKEKKAVKKYSMGMKQRLSIAIALLDKPKVLLLDEPMSNLDTVGADEMRGIFRCLAKDGCTVIIATHIPGDVSELCNEVIYFNDGQVQRVEKVMG